MKKDFLLAVLFCLGFFVILGKAGTSEYNEEMVMSMNQTVVRMICEKIGNSDNGAILKEYQLHKGYYDSITHILSSFD